MTTDLSIVIPARDEVMAIDAPLEEIAHALDGRAFEIIVIDDRSGDGTPELLDRLVAQHHWLRGIRNQAAAGRSTAVRLGVRATSAPCRHARW